LALQAAMQQAQYAGTSPTASVAAGRAVARLLAGAWRQAPPPVDLELRRLVELAPLLVQGGAAGLAWWKLRHAGLGGAPEAEAVRQAARQAALEAALHQQSIRMLVGCLRAARIEPLLVKGWSTARLYPTPGLRPYVDIDLVVPPGQGARAAALLRDVGPANCPDPPDVLDGATWAAEWAGADARGDLADHPWAAVLERSRLVRLGDLPTRVLGPEDQLRLAAVHAMRHRFRRPVWLCDIGLLMETVPAAFDWPYCLAGRAQQTEWLLRSLGLAQYLLGAELHNGPLEVATVPGWLSGSVLRRWGTPLVIGPGPSILQALRQPRRLPEELYRRWPDPLEATLRRGLPLAGRSRLAAQAAEFVWQFGVLASRRWLRQSLRAARWPGWWRATQEVDAG